MAVRTPPPPKCFWEGAQTVHENFVKYGYYLYRRLEMSAGRGRMRAGPEPNFLEPGRPEKFLKRLVIRARSLIVLESGRELLLHNGISTLYCQILCTEN